MIKNYFKIAFRNLLKYKLFSVLNIIGLASGLLCSLLIYLWISDEISTDRHHENSERLYSVYERSFSNGNVNGYYNTPAHLHSELKLKFAEVEKASPAVSPMMRTFANGSKIFNQRGNYVSPDYFDMFSYRFIEGNAVTALAEPTNIAISNEMATLFFGSAKEAYGNMLTYDGSTNFRVSAVYEELGSSVMENTDFFMHWDIFCQENSWTQSWNNNAPTTFIQLTEQADVSVFEPKIKNFLSAYNTNIGEDFNIELYLQPLTDRYLRSNFENGQIAGGRIENVRIFGLIAFFILVIACINFMNLASASSLKRVKEIGVRKVLGAKRVSLVYQFLGEALLLSIVSTVIALIILIMVLPYFNQLTGKDIILSDLPSYTWSGIFMVAIFTGLIAGSYPAFMLSSFRGIDILKKKLRSDFGLKWVRQGLVVFQFSLSVALICGMLVVSEQIAFIQDKTVGFERNNLLTISLQGNLNQNFKTFKKQALSIPGVTSLSASIVSPVQLGGSTFGVVWPGKAENDRTAFVPIAASGDFIKTLGSQLVEGRDFRDSDQNFQYILNETAIAAIGLKDPIGKPISQWGMDGTIVGVIKDFHFETIKESIKPLVIRYTTDYSSLGTMLVRVDPRGLNQTISALQALHTELNPAFPLEYYFTDRQYDQLYESENTFFKLSQYFSFLAIFISCIGLFGLVLFIAQQKIKEIGIRKVLGASSVRITALLAKDFMKLVLLGILIGSPIIWLLMSNWLSDYEYRIEMPWNAFIISAVAIFVIALLTLSFQSIKAAYANPIKSLRTE
ncbi:MAG: ABC transporter permease [Bacteroidota bacterium]